MRLVNGEGELGELARRLDEAVVALSLLAIDAGRWAEAEQHVRAAVDAIDGVLDLQPGGVTAEWIALGPGGQALSAAERRLLPYLRTHLTYQEIARQLFVSRNTVSTEVGSIFRKLGVRTRADAVAQAIVEGLYTERRASEDQADVGQAS